MNETVKSELDRIVSTLAATGIISKIILFGSYARGEETPESDIDLCVLTPEKDKRQIDMMTDFRMMLYGVKTMPMDLFAYNQDVFRFHAERSTSFEHVIAEEGVTLYEHT
jgi:uncharacterized protein